MGDLFATYPDDIRELKVKTNDGRSASIVWEVPEHVDGQLFYKIRCWYGNDDEKHAMLCNKPSYQLQNMKPGCILAIEVATVNKSGQGSWSKTLFLPTAPLPPDHIIVKNNSTSLDKSLIVKIKNFGHPSTYFNVTVRSMSDDKIKSQTGEEPLFIFKDLTPGESYEIFAIALAKVDDGELQSTPVYYNDAIQTCPSTVDEIEIQNTSEHSTTFQWEEVFGADSYVVKWRKHNENFKDFLVDHPCFVPNNLESGEKYVFTVAAANSGGRGKFATQRYVYTDLAPPCSVGAVAGYDGNGANIKVQFITVKQLVKEYNVGLLEDDQFLATCDSEGTTIDRLELGRKYTVYVEAVGMQNEMKSKRTLSRPIWTKPKKATGVVEETTGKYSRLITWKPSESAISYIVMVQVHGETEMLEAVENRLQLNDLRIDEKYVVSVRAKNPGGVGEFSDSISFQTALAPPADVTVNNISNELRNGLSVSFNYPSGRSTRFRVTLDETQKKYIAHEVTSTDRYIEFNDLKPATQYTAFVQALGEDEGTSSDRVCSSAIYTYCAKVNDLQSRINSADKFLLQWKKVAGGKQYQIKFKPTSGSHEIQMCTEHEFLLQNLQLGQTYRASVAAVNEAGIGPESDIFDFRTGFPAPCDVTCRPNSTSPSTSIDVSFKQPDPRPSEYTISATVIRGGDETGIPISTSTSFATIVGLKAGTEYVIGAMSVDSEDQRRNSETTFSAPVWTCPGKVTELMIKMENVDAYYLSWTPVIGATSYEVKWRKQGEKSDSKVLQAEDFLLGDLDLHTTYLIQVTARNSSGNGPPSDWTQFQTALYPPTNLTVRNNDNSPASSIDVKFKTSKIPAECYRIRATGLQGDPDVEITTAKNFATLDKLQSGKPYRVGVTSVHSNDRRLNSEEIFVDEIWTCPAKLKVEAFKLPCNRQKLGWIGQEGGSSFEVRYRIENGEWQTFKTERNKTILDNLEPGTNYECQVAASNQAGKGETSDVITFATVPVAPTNIKWQNVSTNDVIITCNTCHGSTVYEFRITPAFGSKQVVLTSEVPECKFACNGECVKFQVAARAKNVAGYSEYSQQKTFSQVLRFLRQKFQRKARLCLAKESFVAPVIVDAASGASGRDLSEMLSPARGDLILLNANQNCGKTAVCSQYVQVAASTELVIFIDYDALKKPNQKQDVRSLLKLYMSDIDEGEMDSAFEWMKENSRDVTLVIDNLSLPEGFQEESCTYESKNTPANIIYSLITPNRHLLSDCKVLCASSQNSLHRILKPTTHLRIQGLRHDDIQTFITRIFEASENAEIPPHLKYFCCSPGYCEAILNILSKHKELDTNSTPAVIIEVLRQYFERHIEHKTRDLGQFTQEIAAVEEELSNKDIGPKKIKMLKGNPRKQLGMIDEKSEYSTPACNTSFEVDIPQETQSNCQEMHATLTRALYLALLQNEDTFAKKFEKRNLNMWRHSMVWILVSGFLREETTKACIKLFQLDEQTTLKSCRKKGERLKKFIRDNMEKILEQIYVNNQITLDWFACCSEINDKDLLSLCAPRIKIKNDLTPSALDQVSGFLTKVPAAFCGKVKLKKKKDINPSISLTIDHAIRDNPSGDLILQKDYESSSVFSRNKAPSTYARGRSKDQDSRFNDTIDQEDLSDISQISRVP